MPGWRYTIGMNERILVADDEAPILNLICSYLEKAGYVMIPAANGREALDLFTKNRPDLVILDIMMPEKDGIDVAREILRVSEVPIIFLSARSEETDRIVGLELGADDYLVKPFSPRELAARVKVAFRRQARTGQSAAVSDNLSASQAAGMSPPPSTGVLVDLIIDIPRRRVEAQGREIRLTAIQFEILAVLGRHQGQVLKRQVLLEQALGEDFAAYEQTINAHIKNIRKVMGDDADEPRYIETVRSVGYRLKDGISLSIIEIGGMGKS